MSSLFLCIFGVIISCVIPFFLFLLASMFFHKRTVLRVGVWECTIKTSLSLYCLLINPTPPSANLSACFAEVWKTKHYEKEDFVAVYVVWNNWIYFISYAKTYCGNKWGLKAWIIKNAVFFILHKMPLLYLQKFFFSQTNKQKAIRTQKTEVTRIRKVLKFVQTMNINSKLAFWEMESCNKMTNFNIKILTYVTSVCSWYSAFYKSAGQLLG